MYAVVRAVEHFRMFLLGQEFLLRTNHAVLAKLLRLDLPPTSRVKRWILRLSEYTFSIQNQRNIYNVMADVLSRLPFARSSVVEADMSRGKNRNDRTTRNIERNGCTVSSFDAIRPGPSASSGENSSLNFQSMWRSTLSDSVATALTGSLSESS